MHLEFIEKVQRFVEGQSRSMHEQFRYVLFGAVDARVGEEKHQVMPGGIIHIPKNESYHISTDEDACVRFLSVYSTPVLESALDDLYST